MHTHAETPELKRHQEPPSQLMDQEHAAKRESNSPIQQAANDSAGVQQHKKVQEAANAAQFKRPELTASPIQAAKPGTPAPAKDPTPTHDSSAIKDKNKQKQIARACTEALKMVKKGKKNIDKGNAKYKKWMDAGTTDTKKTDKRVEHVKEGFDAVQALLEKEKMYFKNYGLNDGEEDETYAYVIPSEKRHNIYIGGAFWDAAAKGISSKPGTIIHELTHRVHGTKDYAYGEEDCEELAKSAPQKAVKNADNYEFLAETS